MSIIIWIIVGALAGWLASLLTGSKGGLVRDIVVGMIGSLIGGLLYNLLQYGNLDLTLAFTTFNLVSIIVSTLGAIVLIVLLKLF
jgi:uncharacterized membrane protein YeaQ/YmgE (transglycosylase-associated protein family)